MSYIQQFFTSRDNNANAETFVGQTGRLWWDPVTNQIYSSDGNTPGGIPLSGGGGGNGTPGGSNSQVQFNNNSAFGGSANLTFNNVTGSLTAVSFVGNGAGLTSVTGANITGTVANATYAVNAGSAITTATVTANAQPNITSVGTLTGITSSGDLSTTGNISGNYFIGNGSLLTGIAASGYSNANVSAYLASGTDAANIVTTANISGAYILGNGSQLTGIAASGYGNANVVANLAALGSNPISTTGNITSGNVISLGVVSAGTLSVTGNAVISGDLNVDGNVTYFNVNSFDVEDPIIGLGRGANNTPLVTNDGKDRGTALWYYNTSELQSFVGYKNNTGKMFAATDVSVTSEIVTINNYGTFVVGGLEGASVSVTGNVVGGNINTSGVVSAAGNVTGNYILGNGALLTGVITSVDNINNGTSNVDIAAPNANVTVSVDGTSNVAVFAATGQYVTGLISASGNITGANINGNGSGLSSVTGANVTGQVGNALVAGTVYTASQPNITSVGTLTSLSATGNIDGANINGNGSGLSAITGSNVTGQVGNALVAGTVYTAAQPNITSVGTLSSLSSSGNIDGANINGNGSGLSSITGANVTGQVSNALVSGTVYTAAQPNITSVGILTSLSSSGNITGANINGNGSGLSSITGANVTGQVGNALIAGTVYTAAQPNITSVGTLSSLSATGNITGGNVLYGAGQVSGTGNISANNIATTNQISATGNLISNLGLYVGVGATATVLTNPIIVAQASGLAYVQVAAKNTAATGSADFVAYADNGTESAAWADMGMTGAGFNDTAYTITAANDGYVFVQGNVDGTGGLLVLATGENGDNPDIVFATGGFLSTDEKMRFIHATGQFDIETTTPASSTITGALRVRGGAGVAGNIYSGGIVTATGNIVATANVSGGNVLTGGIVSATANVSGGNVLTGGIISATGNVTGGNVLAGSGQITTSGNVTGGNLITSAAVSAASVSASGNVTGANVNTNTLVGTGTTIKSTGDINLSTTGNVVVNSTYINGVTNPVLDQDVATKFYVDNAVSTAISYHQPVAAATTTTLATATGGTISYTQPNGAGNGVGALLTTTGSFDLIDTANVQTIGTRILVKDEANAVYNGVYTWANATNIVRATDSDTYGSGNTVALGLNDYFFTTGGNVNLGAAFVVSAPSGTITFGTSNIVFSTFSTSQTYTANTAAGVSLAGTVINAKTDNISTAFDGTGNIVVKAGAVLTTPNIGAAVATSVSATGNVTGGNVISGGVVSATGNITGSYIIGNGSQLTGLSASYSDANVAAYLPTYTGNLVSLTGPVITTANITGGNINTGGIVSATGNITSIANISGGNVLSSVLIQGVTLSASGNVNGGNLTTPGTVSSTGNITSSGNISGGNITASGIVNATGNITSIANLSGGNVLSSALIQGVTLSASGNVSGGNIIQDGVRVAKFTTSETTPTNAVPGDQWFIASTGKRYEYINDGTSNVWVDQSQSTSFDSLAVSGNATIAGNIAGGNVLGGANVNATTHTGTTVSVTGNITGGNVLGGANVNATTHTGTTVSVTGNITGAAHIGTIYTNSILNTGANSTGNIGSATGYFNTVFAKATSAQYADLAETYAADQDYPYGTVVVFGGSQEITVSNVSHDTRVAGVISRDPAHLMNSAAMGLPVALTGRVLCQVRGPVQKGDILVNIESGTAGLLDPARASWGCVIGKCLEDYAGTDVAMIEIAVGRF